MTAMGQAKQNLSLHIFKTSEELEKMYEDDLREPDLFDLLVDNASFEVYCKTGELPKKKGTKGCKCSKTGCLKMYCQCLANGKHCGSECGCLSCENQPQNAQTQSDSHHSCPTKRGADRARAAAGKRARQRGPGRGCNCKRSGCEKGYCECFSNGLRCGQHCHCVGCNNCELALPNVSTIEDSF